MLLIECTRTTQEKLPLYQGNMPNNHVQHMEIVRPTYINQNKAMQLTCMSIVSVHFYAVTWQCF